MKRGEQVVKAHEQKGEGMEEKSTSRQEETKRGSRLCGKNQSDVEKGMCRNIMLGSSTRGVTD